MIQLFVNRKQELQFLDEHYKTKAAELIVITAGEELEKPNSPYTSQKTNPTSTSSQTSAPKPN
jgi:hypothetical protein